MMEQCLSVLGSTSFRALFFMTKSEKVLAKNREINELLLYLGATVFVHGMPRFTAPEILEVLSSYPITTFCAPPTLYR